MNNVTADGFTFEDEVAVKGPRRPASGWVLMGDIATHRAGVSEHLIQWRRAMGEADPEPMLSSSGWKYSGEREGE